MRRLMTFRTRDEHIALQAARQRQKTPEFIGTYALRAGVEATISQAVRGFGLRRSRYFGQAKTHLQHVASAAAMNLVRLVHWISGDALTPTNTTWAESLNPLAFSVPWILGQNRASP